MMKQDEIIKLLKSVEPGLKISQPRISRIQNGKEKISFTIAIALSRLFPGKDIVAWKNATPEEFKAAWKQYELLTKEIA